MSEEKSKNGCLKAFVIFLGISLLLLGAVGAGGYYLWKKKGAPTLAELKAKMKGEELAEEDPANSEAFKRPIVATAPIKVRAGVYSSYVNKKDVLTLVNYYSDT